MPYLDHIKACNRFDPARFRPLRIGSETVGWVKPDIALRLAAFVDVFQVDDDQVRLSDRLTDPDLRTKAVARVVEALVAGGVLPKLRNEMYPVMAAWGAPIRLRLDRAAVPLFGVLALGVHLNGYVGRGATMKVWIGRRSLDKAVAPGKLDHIVAGGQPDGLSLMENLIKECAEEADIPPALAARSVAAGAVGYCLENEQGLRNDLLFCYDLELPADFVPRNTDGEVESFELMPIDAVKKTLRETFDFKFNVPLVLLDFLIRHGQLLPDEEPDYLRLQAGLRQGPAYAFSL
ncbi:MAG: DUF4743 domain-containing protein [Rhodospirillales bacterium]|nr:DUF4743 domain-containing protein [Rhodospirillales bacterium]